MKKVIIFIIIILTPVIAIAQLSGDGQTTTTAYSGTFQNNPQWNIANFSGGKVFIKGDVTIDNEQLTIGPGMKVIFITEGADLIINGTGSLNSVGNIADSILFTADDNNNGIYGQTGERWGHIVFNNPDGSNQSILSYCIIKWGDVFTGSNTTSYGGGIYTNYYSNLILSNCTITKNRATHGGGVMAFNGASPIFSNFVVSQNTATTSGGGIYLHTNCVSTVTNCIINNNSAGSGGGGGIFFDGSGNVRAINSIFVKNTTSRSDGGYNIQYYHINNITNRPKFINCIGWGNNNSIASILSSAPQPSDFNFCGIQDVSTPASYYLNCIDLSGTNDATTGPNFVDPDLPGLDWSIKFISPCRDTGTDSYSGVIIPTLDFAGNSRVLVTDIGAYEVQYSRWKTTALTTDWADASNWDGGVPTSTRDIIVLTGATNYPIGSTSQNFTIGTGKQMILNPGAKVTLGTLINNGILKLESDASNISSLIATSFSGNDAIVEIYLTGGNPGAPTLKLNKWHFISSPVSSLPVSTFAPTYTQNVVRWYDNQVSGALGTGWIAYDGYRYSTGATDGPVFSDLTPGLGYDFYAADDRKYTFSGQLNTGPLSMILDFTTPPGSASLNGFNLLGNPFSSGLDWDYIINSTSYPLNTSKSLYFTRDNTQCSYIGTVGIPAGVTGIIPPMQGFFVKTYSAGNTITLPIEARVQENIHPRYKGLEIIPLVRLNLAEGTLTDETVVRFDAAAKPGLDYDFDAPKMFLAPDVLSIYSTSDGSNFAINGLPFPDTFVEIPVIVNLTTAGNHTISATQLEGLDNYDVTLTDNTTGFIADLKTTPLLTFSADVGSLANRFVLKIGTITTGTENPVTSKDKFNIYESDNFITIQTVSDQWDGKPGSVKVMDLTGKTVGDLNNAEFSKNSLVRVASPGAKGIYVVEIKSGVMRYVGKVVVK